jgi:hypothetical protein
MNGKNISLIEALKKSGASLEPEQEKFVEALDVALKTRQAESDERYSDSFKEALAEQLGAIEKDENGKIVTFATQLKNIAEALEKVEKQSTTVIGEKEKFQLRKYVRENHKEIVNAIKNGKDLDGTTFTALKEAAMFTNTSAVRNGSGVVLPLVENYLVENDIAVIRHPANDILEAIPSTQVTKVPQQVIRVEQATEEGAVAVVAEGGTKPLTSDTFVRTITTRTKYAGRIEWTEEFEMDNELLFDAIIDLFENKVNRAHRDGIIAKMITNATAYTSSVFDGTFVLPDNGLAVIAGQSVIQGMYFMPNVVVMNPSDIFASMFTQDVDGNAQIKPYIVNNNGVYSINGMRVVSSYVIDQGTVLVGDSSVYREWHSAYIFRVGTYGNQFIENEKTAIGEIFSLLRIANIDKPAWMVLDLEAVKEDLTIVTP